MGFLSFGVIGIIWFFFWNKNVTSYPRDHKKISSEELNYIENNAPASEAYANTFIQTTK